MASVSTLLSLASVITFSLPQKWRGRGTRPKGVSAINELDYWTGLLDLNFNALKQFLCSLIFYLPVELHNTL